MIWQQQQQQQQPLVLMAVNVMATAEAATKATCVYDCE